MFHLLLRWCISVTSSFHVYFDCTVYILVLVSRPTADKKLPLSLCASFEAIIFSHTNNEQIKRKIKLNWGGLAGSDSRECLAYKEEKDQISLCQLCLRTTIFKSYPTSEVLCEQHCYGMQYGEGREEDYNKQQRKLLTN